MKLFAVLLITEVILITASESLSANPGVKRKSLKERLQNIAKEAKRAKRYHHATTWRPYNEYDQGTQDPDFDYTTYAPDYNINTASYEYDGMTTPDSGNYDYNTQNYEYDGMTTPDSGNYDYNTQNYEYGRTTPGYGDYYTGGYDSYTTMGYWEYRRAEEARERHEERINPSHPRGTTQWPFWSDKKVEK